MDCNNKVDMTDNSKIEDSHLDDNYPCIGTDCYDRGNFHVS